MEYDAQEGNYVIVFLFGGGYKAGYQWGHWQAAADAFGPILGDFIHNVRGALDLSAWRLACIKLGRDPSEDEARLIQFPITVSPDAFASSAVLKFIDQEPAEVIESLQPYHAIDPNDDPAALIHWLSNRDKHRLIVPSFGEMLPVDIDIRGGEGIIVPVQQDPTRDPVRTYKRQPEMGRFTIEVISGEPKPELKKQPSSDIRFHGPAGNMNESDLRRILDWTREAVGILDRFL
jgi:hypothetical protein